MSTRALFDEAILDANDPLGVLRHVGIMGDEDDGDAVGAVELLEHLEDFLAGARIEVAGRLVGEEHPRPVDQRPGDGHALLFAAGKLRRLVVDAIRQADFLEQLGCALFLLMLS